MGLDRAGVENYQITLGGDGTETATIGARTGPGFAYDEIVPAVERLLEKERALGPDLKFEDIIEEVAGVYPRIMREGDMDAGAWSCGMVAGLINDIPTCKELIDRIMAEADQIINQRLAAFMKGTVDA